MDTEKLTIYDLLKELKRKNYNAYLNSKIDYIVYLTIKNKILDIIEDLHTIKEIMPV